MDARNIGLRNIEVADTKICSIDGENGKLIYRGYDILDLVNHSTFEETAYLLLFGELPDKTELDDFSYKINQKQLVLWTYYNQLFLLLQISMKIFIQIPKKKI